MTTRIEDIIIRARDTLADPTASRYSDERLLRLVSEGQQDLIKQTRLMRNTYALVQEVNKAIYTLPDDVWIPTRASYQGSKLPFRSYEQMDNDPLISSDWLDHTGSTPLYIIYDRVNTHQFRIYPIPDAGIADSSYVFLGGDPSFSGGQELGVATAITDYSFNSIYGILTTLFDPFFETRYSSPYGVITDLLEVTNPITFNYYQTASNLTTAGDDLIIPSTYDIALKFYVIWHALTDDIDTQDVALGARFEGFYLRELKVIKDCTALNHTSSTDRQTQYSGAFHR
ncbi:hypothetical protein [Caudoviricetes sp.]|nr:hypothetical protein [Caudoviricetes sp.]